VTLRLWPPAIALLLLAGAVSADVPLLPALSVERLETGNTLIAIGGSTAPGGGLVIEVDSVYRLVWACIRGDILWTHSARRLPNGNTLITATLGDRVIEVDPNGNVIWEFADGLSYPNEAFRLASGNTLITDRDNDRVIEVDPGGSIVWSYTNLRAPHNGNRLPNGNTLICDSDRNKVVEVTPGGEVAWQYATGLDWARCARRLPDGNTLITDSRHQRIIEIDTAGAIRWSYSTSPRAPYAAERLPNGNTIISAEDVILEVSPAGSNVWQYPPMLPVAVDESRVVNPASGCSLYVHIHRPITSPPNRKLPAVILVPDASDSGAVYDSSRLADHIASDGFAVLHFDAEGRGRSGGAEDYNGYVNQDGLHACAAYLARQPYVDPNRLGIYSQGYGIVMASGMLARYAVPRVKFLLDFEGPSDRYQVCAESGGHVPVSPDSEAFWLEREAARSIKNVSSAYLRIQTTTDHTGRIPDNRHAIALIDSATAVAHGGAGIAAWTRVNDSVMNPENRTYTPADPPRWIPEAEQGNLLCRELLYLHELETRNFPGVASGPSFIVHRSSLSISPNPSRGHVSIRIPPQLQTANCKLVTVFDASGRLVLSQPVRSSSFILRTSSLHTGVYLVRAAARDWNATAKLVVE
jgi:outer membrane protein assembly factor BamB